MIRLILLTVGLSLGAGCQFTERVIVNEKGECLPWRAHDENPEKKMKWDEDKAKWEAEDAKRRNELGLSGGILDFQSEP